MQLQEDIKYMCYALALAAKAAGRTSPNPMVGAVLVKHGRIVGEGCHLCAGTAHAEVHALNAAGEEARDSTLYVTLEPCSHHGRTGPCAEAVVRAGVKRVVIAMTDPNPKVSGKGIAILKEAGIEVVEGILAREAADLNEAFVKWITCGRPFGILKTAMTFDGKISTVTGQSKWITGPAARERVHELRDFCDAILVGIGTVLADDPELTTRLPRGGRNPLRVIVDSTGRTPLSAKVVYDRKAPTLIAVTQKAPQDRIDALRTEAVEVVVVPENPSGGVDFKALWDELGARGVTSVLVEGGPRVSASAIAANVIDKYYSFIAPKLVGGAGAPGPVAGEGIAELSQAVALEDLKAESIGGDILITGYSAGREARDVYRTCGRIGACQGD